MITLAILACTTPTPESQAPDPAATGPARPVENVSVKLALNWYPEPEFGGFYEGVLGGHYAKAGFDVEILPGGPGAPTLELLATGKVNAAISAADDLLLKRNKGIRAIGVWPAFQLNPQGLMIHKALGYDGYEDVPAGSRIAIEVGSPFQAFLWNTYRWEGKVDPVPYGGQVGPFLADPKMIQQAYITSEPCVAQAAGAEVSFLKASDAGWNPYGSLLTLSEPLPSWAGSFVEATHAAWEAYMADPRRANQEIARLNPALTPEVLDCVTLAQTEFVTGQAGMGAMDANRWQQVASTLQAQGLLPEQSSASEAWKALR
ncbi:MAG: ABC transporter substrate-binding protein [Myxococcota bacterium]|nr:ABC transporter substrate-binding protein [Myxococcota bacterium]